MKSNYSKIVLASELRFGFIKALILLCESYVGRTDGQTLRPNSVLSLLQTKIHNFRGCIKFSKFNLEKSFDGSETVSNITRESEEWRSVNLGVSGFQ